MKRRIAILTVLLAVLFTSVCYGQSNKTVTTAQLKSVLEKVTKHSIKYFGSIDVGGQYAAFAIAVGDYSYEGDVWYVTLSKAKKLKGRINFPDSKNPIPPSVWTVSGTKIFKCESSAGGSGSASFA